jgi:hypothetical protein
MIINAPFSSHLKEVFPFKVQSVEVKILKTEYAMIYFDERDVSRKYISTLKNNVWKWWRNEKIFSQRFTCEIKDDGNTIVSKGEMSRNGKPWEKDIELVYTRILK